MAPRDRSSKLLRAGSISSVQCVAVRGGARHWHEGIPGYRQNLAGDSAAHCARTRAPQKPTAACNCTKRQIETFVCSNRDFLLHSPLPLPVLYLPSLEAEGSWTRIVCFNRTRTHGHEQLPGAWRSGACPHSNCCVPNPALRNNGQR